MLHLNSGENVLLWLHPTRLQNLNCFRDPKLAVSYGTFGWSLLHSDSDCNNVKLSLYRSQRKPVQVKCAAPQQSYRRLEEETCHHFCCKQKRHWGTATQAIVADAMLPSSKARAPPRNLSCHAALQNKCNACCQSTRKWPVKMYH